MVTVLSDITFSVSFKVVAMTSFHAENCCHLLSEDEVSVPNQ